VEKKQVQINDGPGPVMVSGENYVKRWYFDEKNAFNYQENELLKRAQTHRAAGNALTSREWQLLDRYNRGLSFLDVARACEAADKKQSAIMRLERAIQARAESIENAVCVAGVVSYLAFMFYAFSLIR
jgi:hypothetical protein